MKEMDESGGLATRVDSNTLEIFRRFDWKNEGVGYQIHSDPEYKKKNVPTVIDFERRNRKYQK